MTGRIMVALLVVIPAAMAYPWRGAVDWWLLGIAVTVVVVVFAWWRGTFLTTVLRRRLALLRRNDTPRHLVQHSDTDALTTVVLRVQSEHEVPLSTLAGYLDRYGIRCDSVRVTHRDTPDGRATWIGLTLSAAANLAALQARSSEVPLRETAEVTLRRLADHLRELGHSVGAAESDLPDLVGPDVKERWRAVQDGSHGFVTCYEIPADQLAELGAVDSPEVWTVLELTGSPVDPQVTAVCAVRTDEQPTAAPIPPLQPLRGRQRATLTALHPGSSERLLLRT